MPTDLRFARDFNVVLGFGLAIGVALLPIVISNHGFVQGAPAGRPKSTRCSRKDLGATPGCAVGVAPTARRCSRRAMAWPISSTTSGFAGPIFEAGSVSKQFTAAAVMLLARDGKLSLDDQVRRVHPRAADYPLPRRPTRQAARGDAAGRERRCVADHPPHATHTSGLRDWGSVAGIARLAADDARLHARARAGYRRAASRR